MNKTEFEKVKNHPYHQYLGIENIEAKNGKAEIELAVKSHILNPSGTFHGGVLYTLSDITAFCALISLLEENEIGVTNHFSIQVMRAVRTGTIISFQAEVIKLGKRLAFVECNAFANKKLVAKATVTKTLIKL